MQKTENVFYFCLFFRNDNDHWGELYQWFQWELKLKSDTYQGHFLRICNCHSHGKDTATQYCKRDLSVLRYVIDRNILSESPFQFGNRLC